MNGAVTIVESDLSDPAHAAALVQLLDAYMRDPMEGGEAPPERTRRELVPGLRAHRACHVFLAWAADCPIGFAICFLGFSTFQARPLINIHDLFVVAEMRGRGVGLRLLDRIEARAHELGCCRLTLEVRQDNQVARGLYGKFGFGPARFGPALVPQEFWTKPLSPDKP